MKNQKHYLTITSIIFTIVSFAHLLRIIFMLDVNVAGVLVPLWASGVAVVVAGYLATRGFMEAHKL